MEIKIQSIHFDATEKLQAFIEKKIAKLEKTYEDIQKVEVQLKVVKPATALNKEVHLEIAVPGSKLFVEKTCDTFEEGVAGPNLGEKGPKCSARNTFSPQNHVFQMPEGRS